MRVTQAICLTGPPAEGRRDSPENETRTRCVGGDPEREATLPCGPLGTVPPVGVTLSHDEGACLPEVTLCGFHQLTGRQVQLLKCANGHKEWAGASVKSLSQVSVGNPNADIYKR